MQPCQLFSKIHLDLQELALVARSCPWFVFIFSKKRLLELIQEFGWGERRDLNPHYQSHNLTCYRYTTLAIGRGCKNRTHSSGFGDLLAALAYPLILVVVCPPRVFSFLFHYYTSSQQTLQHRTQPSMPSSINVVGASQHFDLSIFLILYFRMNPA